ncbi:hypothetical protein CEXT_351571 [Caerostris extrusa]|uniref:Uncharacterized protein n=1 Tax=Caerostris extrusa TaxID=172846 RepID=A0AAV4UTE3_CAEEX|nr:hypothetical protein CEXT_351571 [Caerostris extrusa]
MQNPPRQRDKQTQSERSWCSLSYPGRYWSYLLVLVGVTWQKGREIRVEEGEKGGKEVTTVTVFHTPIEHPQGPSKIFRSLNNEHSLFLNTNTKQAPYEKMGKLSSAKSPNNATNRQRASGHGISCPPRDDIGRIFIGSGRCHLAEREIRVEEGERKVISAVG